MPDFNVTSHHLANPGYALIGNSAAVLKARELAELTANGKIPVHVTGESGTGKELVARLIYDRYNQGHRRPFIDLNCAAVPKSLIESELFGYQQGAFTDARSPKPGLLERADNGVLFLDEIGEIERPLQMKLVRAIEYGFRRLGGVEEKQVDSLIVTADIQRLEDLIKDGRMVEPFFYRIKGLTISLPPLRDRPDDVPLLAGHYAREFSNGTEIIINQNAYSLLQQYNWPGNVRQFVTVMKIVIATKKHATPGSKHLTLDREDFEQAIKNFNPEPASALERAAASDSEDASHDSGNENGFPTSLDYYLKRGIDLTAARIEFEKHMIEQALRVTGGDKTRAGALLGINRSRVYNLTRTSSSHKVK